MVKSVVQAKASDQMRLRVHLICLWLVAPLFLLHVAGVVQAGLAIQFLNTTSLGSQFSYNYNVVFTDVTGQESLIGNLLPLSPGIAGSADFVTIYDIKGYVSATPGESFIFQKQPFGVNGPQTLPADDPTDNITFQYTGETVSANKTFSGFSIISTFGIPGLDNYTSQRTNDLGMDATTKIGEVGTTVVPLALAQADPVGNPVPEPGTLAIWGSLGLVGLVARWRRRGKRAI